MEEHTTFEETIVENEARIPSFTLCPDRPDQKSIESFEDVVEEIENAKTKYKISYRENKPYEETKIVHETFNQTFNDDWYFAPRVAEYYPFETLICLIMTPLRSHKLQPDWTVAVSYYNGKNFKVHILIVNWFIFSTKPKWDILHQHGIIYNFIKKDNHLIPTNLQRKSYIGMGAILI